MKILHLIDSLNPRHGGTTYGLRGLVEELRRLGHETEILVLDEADSEWLESWPCPVHACGRGLGKYRLNPAFAWRACHLVRRFDHVLVHGLWQFHGVAAWLACLLAGVPYAVFPHGMLDGWSARRYPLKHLKKRLYWRLFEHRLLRDSETVFFTTEGEWLSGRTTFAPFAARPAFAAFGVSRPPGELDAHARAWRARHPELAGKRVLLFLGRIHIKKGCDLLIQAGADWLNSLPAAERAQWHLRLVGPCEDTSYLEGLRQTAERAGLTAAGLVSFAPAVAGEEKWQELCGAEVLVLPSHQENFGVVIAEAFACRRPVLISDKVNGWGDITAAGAGLAATDDLAGTRQLLEGWARLEDGRIADMQSAALQYYEQHMSATVSARALLSRLDASSRPPKPEHAPS
jgi:glycosyltransferase involved in cell wall biosynthesis